MNFSTCTYIVPTNRGVRNGRTNAHRRDRIYDSTEKLGILGRVECCCTSIGEEKSPLKAENRPMFGHSSPLFELFSGVIYAVRRFIAAQLINSKNEAGNHPYSAHIRPRRGDESLDAIMAFTVGTAFMPSSDASQHITMNPGGRHVEAVHGDESPDAINRVPTRMRVGQWDRRDCND
jgi:hypothetical protein